MYIARDIAEARDLLERAERESDPEQESHHIEEALALLEALLSRDTRESVCASEERMNNRLGG